MDFAIGNERLMRDIGMKKLATDEETTVNGWKSQAKSVVISAYRVKNSPEEEGFQSAYCLALAARTSPRSYGCDPAAQDLRLSSSHAIGR